MEKEPVQKPKDQAWKLLLFPVTLAILVGVLSWMSNRERKNPDSAARMAARAQASGGGDQIISVQPGVEPVLKVNGQPATPLQEEVAKLEDITNSLAGLLADRSELTDAQERLAKSDEVLRARDQKIADLEKKATQLAAVTAELESTKAALASEKAVKGDLLGKLSQAQAGEAAARKEIEGWQALQAKSQERLAALALEADARAGKIRGMEAATAALKVDLEKSAAVLAAPNPELLKAKAEALKLRDELEAAKTWRTNEQAVKGQLLAQISEMRTTVNRPDPALYEQLTYLEGEIEAWKTLQAGNQARLLDASKEECSQIEAMESLKAELAALKARLAEEARIKSELLRKISGLQIKG